MRCRRQKFRVGTRGFKVGQPLACILFCDRAKRASSCNEMADASPLQSRVQRKCNPLPCLWIIPSELPTAQGVPDGTGYVLRFVGADPKLFFGHANSPSSPLNIAGPRSAIGA